MKSKFKRVRQLDHDNWLWRLLCSEPGCTESGELVLRLKEQGPYETGAATWYCADHATNFADTAIDAAREQCVSSNWRNGAEAQGP